MKKIVLIIFLVTACCGALQAQVAITAQFPQATIAGKSSGTITADEVKKAGQLGTTNTHLTITAFTVVCGTQRFASGRNCPKFTKEQLRAITGLQKGSAFSIEDITTLTPQGKEFMLQKVVFKLE